MEFQDERISIKKEIEVNQFLFDQKKCLKIIYRAPPVFGPMKSPQYALDVSNMCVLVSGQ